ncbi:MAG: GDSL-type esterase/lipase family protein [Candidatus Eisenbacteria bacterium]
MRTLRFVFAQAMILLAVSLLAIFAAEQWARHRFPDLRYAAERQQRAEGLFIRFDPATAGPTSPVAAHASSDWSSTPRVHINEDGFQGTSHPGGTNSRRVRILVLGDSYVFGHGVEDDETFCAVLAHLLPSTEVLNFGVSGYSTDQELLLLQDRGLAYHPDVVLLCLYRNDILDNGRATAWGLYQKPRFTLNDHEEPVLAQGTVSAGVPFGMKVRRELRRRFVLYDVLAYRLAALRTEADEEPDPASARTLTHTLIARIAADSRAAGAHFLLVVLPETPEPDALLDGIVGARLDLEPVFEHYRQTHPDSALSFQYDSHWLPRGHRLVAEAIADKLPALRWLAPVDSLDTPSDTEDER